MLSASPIDQEIIKLAEKTPHIAVGYTDSLNNLRTVAIELLALKQIEKEDGKINHDLIAKKEIANRIHLATNNLENELNYAFRSANWKNQYIGKQEGKQPLSVHASIRHPFFGERRRQ